MKKFALLPLAVCITIAMSISSCSKDDAPDTPAKTSVTISKIKVVSMPFTDPGCTCAWDASSAGPDLFFTINDATGALKLKSTPLVNDVLPAQIPLTWTLNTPYTINDISSLYSTTIWDDDGILNPQNIGGFSFIPSNYAPTYPTTITLQNSSVSTLKVELTVSWQ